MKRPYANPPYVQRLLNKNIHLWKSKESKREKEIEIWITSIHKQLTNLRGDTNNPPFVSVVIPANNEEEHLLLTLQSIADQRNIKNVEVIVVANNCDKDDRTAEFARKCGAVVLEYKFKDEKIQPISYARQRGLEIAKGEIVVSADADIIALPKWLNKIVKPFENPRIGATTSYIHNYYMGENNARVAKNNKFRTHIRNFFQFSGFIGIGNNTAFRRTEALASGGYNLFLYPGEDVDIGVKLTIMRAKRFDIVKDPQAAVWASPRRIKAFGTSIIFSRFSLTGKILYVRDSFRRRKRRKK